VTGVERLPIDEHLPQIVERLERSGGLVLVADPGAGKTTRIPRALLDAAPDRPGEILVLEPRRLAARLAARRVAHELDEPVGERVGFQVRFEDVSSPRTRVRFVTEGILARRLVAEPTLPGVAVVLLDEFHERHLQGDLALALLRRLRRGPRPDLRLGVLSATLDAAPVARFLDVEPFCVPGRCFPVDVRFAERDSVEPSLSPRDLGTRIAGALRRLLAATGSETLDGDVLVFLPGAAAIRAALAACAPLAASAELLLVPLHGDLPPADQDRAVQPAARRKVILSTNVAETSVTIDGVTTVIDAGLARVARHSPWSGLPSLETERISQASAAQRAGRAGRTRPGRCLRLYTKPDHDRRPPHETPEIRRSDLAETVLALRATLGRAEDLAWLEPPPAAALEAAEHLLDRLGALAPDGRPNDRGRRMLALPLHPRLARLVLAAEAAGVADEGCLLAALLSERDLRRNLRTAATARTDRAPAALRAGPSDLLDRAELFLAAEGAADKARALDLDAGVLRNVARARAQVLQALARTAPRDARAQPRASSTVRARLAAAETALLQATLAAFPDRVARRRGRSSDELLLAGGGSARLAETSVVRDGEWLVAVDAEASRDRSRGGAPALPIVRSASHLEPDWLLDLFPDRLVEKRNVRFDARSERVEATSELLYDNLVLHEGRIADAAPEVERVLAGAALAAGARAFCDPDALATWRARLAFAVEQGQDVPAVTDEALAEVLRARCRGRRSFSELRDDSDGGLLGMLHARLTPAQRARLERFAPERVELPGGRKLRVAYEPGRPPSVASRLQDFFGLREGPRVADGRVPLVLHLLAPNQRAVQVTTDLAGFWERHYPAIRRELMRRYPRHPWPEDPTSASPPRSARR
jgi:ATP-dependent helicase HrpB